MEATPERLGIDPEQLARLSEKTDVSALLDRLDDLDARDLERLSQGARPARPQRSPEPPPVDGDFYDVFEDLTEKQQHVRQQVRTFMEETVAPRANEAWEKGVFPRDLIPAAGDLFADIMTDGYTFPPEDPIAVGLVSYEMSRVDPSFCTFWGVHTGLSMGSLAMFGSDAQKEKYLRPMETFDMIGSWALTEPKHGSDASRGLETTAEKKGDTWILNGAKKWSGNATFADVNVIWARDTRDGNVKGFLVELGTDGYEVEKLPGKISKRAVENVLIEMNDVEVPEANRLPGVEKFADVGLQLASCRAGVAWEAAGLAAGAYEKALEYCNERIQFGKRITSFQMVQDQLVRMLGKVTALQTFVMQLGRQEARDGYITPERASLAKVWCCDTMREVVSIARGLMGGNGILLEHDVARLFADAEAVYAYEGSREMNALIVGRGITGQSAFV
ncbi:acyl-CoA dehydrogenase family protein [Longibacter sp.]|uniref:acyl-CoA dehydrogenase family protein n=1 Tax=Longibacter sp. TaxID=2045415 RepID=UPI003EB72FF2